MSFKAKSVFLHVCVHVWVCGKCVKAVVKAGNCSFLTEKEARMCSCARHFETIRRLYGELFGFPYIHTAIKYYLVNQ